MKQKHLTLLSLLFLCIGNLKSQTETFNLSDYIRPDFKNHILDSNFGLDQDNNTTKSFNQFSNEQTFSLYSGRLRMSYFGVKNSASWQKESSISTDLFYQRSHFSNSDNGSNERRSNIVTRTTSNVSLREYHTPKFFFEIGYLLSHSFSKDKTISEFMGNESTFKTKNTDLIFYTPIKFGQGRIENVSDARHAIFIIDALKENQTLSRDLTHDEIIEFAEVITNLKNKRFFDFRLRRIAELKALHAFLKSKEIIINDEIEYYTMLNDRWSFGDRGLRQSGSRFSFVILPGYNRTNVNGSFFSEAYKTNAYNIQGGIEYVHEKPINQNWQSSTSSYLFVGSLNGTTTLEGSDTKLKVNIPKFTLGLNQSFGFFPDTRTSINYSIGFHYDSYVNKIDQQENEWGLDGEYIFISNKLNITYFVSPRFSVSVTSNADFINFLTTESGFQVRNEILNFMNFPSCQNLPCDQFFLASKKRNQFRFGISMAYSLF